MTLIRRIAAIAALTVLVIATPAAADPPKPTDYRSEITRVDPDVSSIEVEVVGGDGFLRLRVERDHEVIVSGYRGEPYLRFSEDGTIEQNLRSEATYINGDRYGMADVPTGLDPDDEPQWEVVDDDGEHAWHDHRIHWMSPERPPGRSAGDVVFDDWTVPVTVDGAPVVVHGMLTWVESSTPLPWFALAALVAVVLALAARRWSSFVAATALLVAGVIAVVVGTAERAASPAATGASPLTVVIPAAATVAAVGGVARHRHPSGAIAALASVSMLCAWAVLRYAVWLRPVLPTELSPDLDRAGTAIALGVAVATGVAVIASGRLRLPALSDDSLARNEPE